MFKIKITETKQVRKTLPRQWQRLTSAPKEGESEYGYTDEVETLMDEERDVLIQQVEDLDVAAVIKAINKI